MQDASKNIFVSYTTRDGEINKQQLLIIEAALSKFGKVYIDLLHNDFLQNPQKKVIDKLINSDLLILIRTSKTLESEWVNLELKKARVHNIKILNITLEEILSSDFNL